MLKNLVYVFLTWVTFSSAHAQNSQYNVCVNSLKYHFLASQPEAATVCRQNDRPDFLQCMAHRAKNSNIHVLDAAIKCSQVNVRIPLQAEDSRYINLRSCPSKLQMGARMNDDRARQICDWDSSAIMQNCLIDLVERAQFHSEHAIQYCGFANKEYRNKIPQFVSCVINNSRKGYDVYSNVVSCDLDLSGRRVTKPQPRVNEQPEPRYEPDYQIPSTRQPEVKAPAESEVKTAPQEQPASTASGRKIPTPVEIKIEGSSNPEIKDQPIDTGSTSNSESLPL